jgi:hypothetical protein
MASSSPAKGSVCPVCAGLGSLFVPDAEGRKVQVSCGHSVCQGKMEERIGRHVMAELFRHLPPELTKKAKR